MKTLSTITILALVAIGLAGCSGFKNDAKSMKAQIFGIKRIIKLYDGAGKVIRQWETDTTVEDQGSSAMFLDADGKSVIINGTFIIQEK